jgi:hypothetical protein
MAYSLDSIVKEYLTEINDNNLARYRQIYTLAVSGLREFNMDTTGVPKIAELEILSTDRADLPSDYLQYTRIALCGRDGRLHSLGRNDDLCLNRSFDDCGNVERHTGGNDNSGDWMPWTIDGLVDNYRNGELMGRFFGIGGGNNANGYYRVDKANNQILFGNLAANTESVIMEYIADISAIDGDFEVHPFVIEALKGWIRYKYFNNNPNSSLGRIDMAKRDYFREKRLASERFGATTVNDWLEAFRFGNKAAPKF